MAISADQPISTRIERVGDKTFVYVDPAWFRYFVDVGDIGPEVAAILLDSPTIGSPTLTGTTTADVLAANTILTSPFIAPALTNGWANFGAPYQSAGYVKDSFGFVHLRGMVNAGTVGLAIFTLPANYRPQRTGIYAVVSNGALGIIEVSSAGTVTLTAGSNVYASLSGITFMALV